MNNKKPAFPIPEIPSKGPKTERGRRIYSDIPGKPKRESIRVPTSDTSKPGTSDKKGGTK